jgi:protein O-mannosyl-transferase
VPARLGLYDLLAASSLVVLVWVVFAPSLEGPFVFDDANSISQSELVRHITPLWRFVVLSTRPLTDFSFAVDFGIDELRPRAYHATSILLHALNAVLAYLLVWRTLMLPGLAPRYGAASRLIAWVAAAAFAVHPLATESVAYVSSRSEVLAASFMLLAANAYVIAATAAGRRTRLIASIALPVCVAAALGSKEIAVTTPAFLLVYDWCFLAEGRVRGNAFATAATAIGAGAAAGLLVYVVASGSEQLGGLASSLALRAGVVVAIVVGFCRLILVPARRWKLIALSCAPFAAGIVYLLSRFLSPTGLGDYGASAGLTFDRFGWPAYLMTQFGVIVRYLRLVVVPTGLNFDYDWPLQQSFFSPEVILPLLLLLALIAAALVRARRQPVLSFAVLGMMVLLAPTSTLLPLADLVVEHRMYLPLLGLMFLAATLAWDLARWAAAKVPSLPSPSVAFLALALVPLAVFATVCRARAALWADPIGLHEDAKAKAPGNPRVRLNLGVTYLNLGKHAEAERELAEAKRLYDLGVSVHAFDRIGAFIYYNLGAVQYLRGHLDQAPAQLERSLEMGGQYLALRPMALYILARIAFANHDWPTAVKRFREALRYNNFNPGWYIELASAELQWGRPGLARRTLEQGLEVHPANPQISTAMKALPTPRPFQRRMRAKRGKGRGTRD